MIYICVLLLGAFAMLVLAAYILGAALITYAVSKVIDILCEKVRKLRK